MCLFGCHTFDDVFDKIVIIPNQLLRWERCLLLGKLMTRTNRLLSLMQLLHQYRYPLTAVTLAEKLGVSVRTIYRDIESLRQQGVDIAGEAGIGFVLKESFLLPPMMLTIQQIEALILGSRWVNSLGDDELANAAKEAITKIKAVIPKPYQLSIEENTLFVAHYRKSKGNVTNNQMIASTVRTAIRQQKQCELLYEDEHNQSTSRIVYPFGLAFFDDTQVVMAWCCLRSAFRHFRVDRIETIKLLDVFYYPNKQQLLKQWQHQQNIILSSFPTDTN